MKKLWLLSPFILSMLAAPLFADETDIISFDNSEIATGYVIGQTQKKMKADKSNCSSCCEPAINYRLPTDFWGIDTSIEYLLWQVQEQASYFVVNNTPATFDNQFPSTYAQGTVRSAKFDWSSGIRVGFGYSFGRDVWQLLGQYTWYKTDGQKSYSVQTPLYNGTDFIASNYLMQPLLDISNNAPTQASSNSYFSYQMSDLMLSSAFLATEQIQFNYSFGATGGYIKENWDITYYPASTPDVGANTYWHNHWRFAGGGFRAGADTNWHIGRGFGLFGKVSFAALLGQYRNHARVTIDGSSTLGTGQQNSTYEGLMLLPTSQFMFGLDWARSFIHCWVSAVRVSIAGEFNHLSDLQQVFKTTYVNGPKQDKPTTRDIGSVYMYGGTARLGVDY
ncbi:MAG TPA: Lpg1974 family pore-forming outer membrane protein [Chlamydiales bacterium]|jgi:hypothetical protein|nr:Lpg1974 family pore-forming outer membrane protein [Chlamydiales bacterium]